MITMTTKVKDDNNDNNDHCFEIKLHYFELSPDNIAIKKMGVKMTRMTTMILDTS